MDTEATQEDMRACVGWSRTMERKVPKYSGRESLAWRQADCGKRKAVRTGARVEVVCAEFAGASERSWIVKQSNGLPCCTKP
jgi:hypothetical protein